MASTLASTDEDATKALLDAALDKQLEQLDSRQVRRVRQRREDTHVDKPVLRLTPASTIVVRPVRWLWTGRLAIGSVALLGGREGVGKSLYAYTLAADVTRGVLPGAHAGKPRGVIVVATEDAWEYTIVPRLMAAGADLDRIYRINAFTATDGETSVVLPRDLDELHRMASIGDAALVILDPLLSRLDASLDSHKDAEVRKALEPLAAFAEVSGVCVLGLIHVNKSSTTDALSMLMGSRAFAAVARAVLFVVKDPDDAGLRLLGQPKNNLGRADDLPTLAFRVTNVKVAETAEGEVWTGRLEWAGEATRTIADAIESSQTMSGDKTATSEAADWLTDFLASEPDCCCESAKVKKAARSAEHSLAALQRARIRLGVTTKSLSYPRRTYWALPKAPVVSPCLTSLNNETTETTTTTETTGRDAVVSVVPVVGEPARERDDRRRE